MGKGGYISLEFISGFYPNKIIIVASTASSAHYFLYETKNFFL
jgi:hypothetical protein